jgi:hypothetical protein
MPHLHQLLSPALDAERLAAVSFASSSRWHALSERLDGFFGVLAIAVVTLVVFAFRPAIKRMGNYVANLYFERAATKAAIRMRKPGPPTGAVRVRQTDRFATMSGADRHTYRRAELALMQGQVREAAQLFESIKFQRRAIDELEKVGLVDDACAVLLRLNVPGRAGAIYEKHRQFDRAAHYYQVANQHDAAGKALLKLAETDASALPRAGEAFAKANKALEAFDAYAAGLCIAQAVRTAVHFNLAGPLIELAADPSSWAEVAACLTPDERDALVRLAPTWPRSGRLLAGWVRPASSRTLVAEILRKTAVREDTALAFWAALEPELATALRGSLADAKELAPTELARHTLASDQCASLVAAKGAARAS